MAENHPTFEVHTESTEFHTFENCFSDEHQLPEKNTANNHGKLFTHTLCTTMKMNAQVVNCLKILEFNDIDVVPMMKQVKKKFLRLVKAKHPDGGIGTEEDFIELFEAKEFLMNFIKLNHPLNEDEEKDDEELLARKEFDLANITKLNKDSVSDGSN